MEKPKAKIQVYLSVFGDYFNPDELTQILEIIPTDYHIKGEEIPLNKNSKRLPGTKPRRYLETVWKYGTGYIHDYDSEKACKIIEENLRDKVPLINEFAIKHNLDITLKVVPWFADDHTPTISFSKSMIKMLGELNADIYFDVYFNF